jgi:glycosyltransferase involved in cell wall biosynthesis
MFQSQDPLVGEVVGVRGDGVTVVIPAYEAWPALERTLRCIEIDARRLDRPCQIVVVDNGSSAGTILKMRRFARTCKVDFELVRRRDHHGIHFRPGTARNIGVDRSGYDYIVFLDADCIPAVETLQMYCLALDANPEGVFIGHREFIDAMSLRPREIASDRGVLDRLSPVGSSSNYKQPRDRRLDDLRRLGSHPRPYDCLHGCNFGLSKQHFRRGIAFDPTYDGAWGYEDIDLGYQLHQRDADFHYLPEAFVYHQEATLPLDARRRNRDRLRNIRILDAKIGDFILYREGSDRVCPLPLGLEPDAPAPVGRKHRPAALHLGIAYALSSGLAG